MFFSRPAGHKLVDRGDPTDYDWIIGDFTIDSDWHDLDCSSIVPIGAMAILFKVEILDDEIGKAIHFRKKGNTDIYNESVTVTQVVNLPNIADVTVLCGSNSFVQYMCSVGLSTGLFVTVRGWII